ASPVNFINPEKKLVCTDDGVSFESVTTGNSAGLDLLLAHHASGELSFDSGPARFSLPIAMIGSEPFVVEAGGLDRRVMVQRLPETLQHRCVSVESRVALNADRDTPLWVCVVQEDGHRAWSSPIYVIV